MSLKNLMHSLIGQGAMNAAHPLQNATSITTGNLQNSILAQMGEQRRVNVTNKKLFHGNIEVLQVANGYIVNIGRKEGYEYETHIATTITEVNEIIAAQIVAFRLEDK